jgi:cysteine desulfurase
MLPFQSNMTYFDHNATAPLHPDARQAWLEAAEKFIGNPSSPHRVGARADAALEDARSRLAAMMGCAPHDIVWTSGATEANNQVLHHFARTLPAEATVCISAIEHPSVTESAAHYFGARARRIPVSRDGAVDLDWMAGEMTRRRPGLVAVMAANNVTGVLQPWEQIGQLCRRWEVPYFCDAVQWLGKESASGLGACDFVSGCAHKVGGPRGVGFLKCPSQGRIKPLLFGGPQEEGRRAGTENVAGVLALVAMLETRHGYLCEQEARRQMRDRFIRRLVAELPGVEIVGVSERRLWNTVAAMLPDADCRVRWVVKLDKLGVAVSSGSACSSGEEEPSPVLLAMGYAPSQAGRVLRFSSGWETCEKDWEKLLDAIKQAAEQLGQVESP